MDIGIACESHEIGFQWSELLPYTPHLLWVLFLAAIFFIVGPRNLRNAVSRTTKVGFAGLELEFSGELQEAAKARNIDLPAGLRDQLVRRMKVLEPLVRSTRILWIDDNPANNLAEINVLRKLGTLIDLSTTDNEARKKLAGAVYDVVISDIGRDNNDSAGVEFLPEILSSVSRPNVVFYVEMPRDTPKGAFGLTTRPDELFNLLLDATERRRG